MITSLALSWAGLAADTVRDAQWHLTTLKVTAAQTLSAGAGVTVAVIDTGVDGTHPDLEGQILRGTDLVSAEGGDGWTDIAGHGTAIAGLIAAHGRALGIAPESRLLPVRNLAGSDIKFVTHIDAAIDYARI